MPVFSLPHFVHHQFLRCIFPFLPPYLFPPVVWFWAMVMENLKRGCVYFYYFLGMVLPQWCHFPGEVIPFLHCLMGVLVAFCFHHSQTLFAFVKSVMFSFTVLHLNSNPFPRLAFFSCDPGVWCFFGAVSPKFPILCIFFPDDMVGDIIKH